MPKSKVGFSNYLVENIEKKILAKSTDFDIKIFRPTENRDENEDIIINNLNEAVLEQPDIILLTPPPSKEKLFWPVIKAIKKGICLITIDDNFEVEDFLEQNIIPPINIRINYSEGGRIAALILKEKLDKSGDIAIISGPDDSLSSNVRKNSFINEILKEAPRMKIVSVKSTNWGLEEARTKMLDIMKSGMYIDGIFCCNDRLAIGAYQALEKIKKSNPEFSFPIIVGHDGIKDIYSFIIDQKIHGSVDQNIDILANYACQEVLEAFSNKQSYLKNHKTRIIVKPSKLTREVLLEKGQ